MSVEVISSGQCTAKKRHRCTWCGQWIEPGEYYTKEFVKVDGDPSWNKLHPECDGALAELCSYEGGTCTYTPYDNERPAPPQPAPKTCPYAEDGSYCGYESTGPCPCRKADIPGESHG